VILPIPLLAQAKSSILVNLAAVRDGQDHRQAKGTAIFVCPDSNAKCL